MSLRICHISTVHVPSDVRVFHRECRSLALSGYEVHLVIPAAKSEIKDGVHVHSIRRVRSRSFRILLMPWVAMRAALKTKAAIFHYHDPELVPVGFVLRWLLRKRVVYDLHEAVPRQIMGKPWLPKWSRRTVAGAYSIMERLLTPGQVMVLANEGWAPRGGSKKYLVRNFPHLSDHSVNHVTPVSSRLRPPLLVYVGGLSEDRGGDLYVELASELRRNGREFNMKLIGPAMPGYERELRDRITKLDLMDRVQLTGRMEHAEAMRLVSDATIGLCLLMPAPNYTTCLATKILEYMMLGTPVLASAFDAWRPYVEGEGSGLMANPLDLSQVVAMCERMLDDPAQLDVMGRRGAEAVQSRYNWASEFKELERCYRELLNPSAAV